MLLTLQAACSRPSGSPAFLSWSFTQAMDGLPKPIEYAIGFVSKAKTALLALRS